MTNWIISKYKTISFVQRIQLWISIIHYLSSEIEKEPSWSPQMLSNRCSLVASMAPHPFARTRLSSHLLVAQILPQQPEMITKNVTFQLESWLNDSTLTGVLLSYLSYVLGRDELSHDKWRVPSLLEAENLYQTVITMCLHKSSLEKPKNHLC